MKKPKRIEEMNAMERAATLRRLSQTLHFSAVVARQAGDMACKQLEELADRLLRDGPAISADRSEVALNVIAEAMDLLGRFEMNHPASKSTLH
ncbi:hypothetical protein [Rhizobium mesosinicum]|uniref:Uncharacterized protein n=1 Tax=Rhizobium mesosinicum TaxID=335017 RepID=A0ABS7GZP4_9HYPH|nr:hypothetical protein [Rhizobium mesosinicum]MBW9054835.1 hypothetical protein [Rhizobium mesosinicum]